MKCSNCGINNPDQNKFCFNCGTRLLSPLKAPPAKSFNIYFLGKSLPPIMIALPILVLVICVFDAFLMFSSISSSLPSLPALPTMTPASTGSDRSLTYDEITGIATQLTEIKRNDYYKSLIGKSLHGSGKIANVRDNGDIYIRISSTFGYDVVLQGVAETIYTILNLNDPVEFDGTIILVGDVFGSGRPTITVQSFSLKTQ